MLAIPLHLVIACMLAGPTEFQSREAKDEVRNQTALERIRPSRDGSHFVGEDSGKKFLVWGLNYDHDAGGRLIEEYWHDEWGAVVRHFYEMKMLGANVVRIHLQLPAFMRSATEPNEVELARLRQLLELAEQAKLYLNITGLGCYHKQAVPPWYDALGESERWTVQARFWEAVAEACAGSQAVFCYNLMNEPILPGGKKQEAEWLAGELGGKHFVQRISLNLAGRSQKEVAKAWVELLVAAIRKHDQRPMVTVGVIPWAHAFPKAKPLFYSEEVGEKLDFVSVHFYPEKGEVEKALAALRVYHVGKPLVVEEMFPLRCGVDDLDAFIDGSLAFADGWMGFYWGQTIADYAQNDFGMAGAVTKSWLEFFRDKGPEIFEHAAQAAPPP